MKKSVFLVGFLSSIVFFTGCSEDELIDKAPVRTGDEIVFGAVGSFETKDANANPQTKTIYGDIFDGKQDIKWVPGTDKIMIYSPQAKTESSEQAPVTEYTVTSNTGVDENRKDYGSLSSNEESLLWGAAEEHTFYAAYPATSMLSAEYAVNFEFEDGKFAGYIPVTQAHNFSKSAGGWEAKCNMNYAHMVAKTVVNKSSATGGVNLDFYPVVTALDITLTAVQNGESENSVQLTALNVTATDGDAIAGKYSTDLTAWDGITADMECTIERDASLTENRITVPLYTGSGESYEAMTLNTGESVTLTVFMLPHTDLDNIRISVTQLNTGAKSQDLNITLEKHKKTRISMELAYWPGPNTWFSSLDDNIYFSQVSIPGTANSFSGVSGYGNQVDIDQRTQTVSIEEQWNAGIRCFELRCPNSNGNNLSDAQLQCNRRNIGITFGEAVKKILDLLADSPREFVIIMPSFETEEGRGNNPLDYLNDLNNFYTNLSLPSGLHFQTYSPEMIVKTMRGGVMFVARITSEEDSDALIESMHKIGIRQGMAINQWGSLKDYWGRRGYIVDKDRAANWSKSYDEGTEVEPHMMNTNENTSSLGYRVQAPQKSLGSIDDYENVVNFEHTSFRSDGSDGIVFVQDWARVVPESSNYRLYNNHYAYWPKSYEEKQIDVWNTFKLSQRENETAGASGHRYFINSLDGYYVSDDFEKSYWPYIESNRPDGRDGFGTGGTEGDIASYASDINNWFYNRLLQEGIDNITGPLNIVIMDRVLEERGGQNLPQVIIDNNFKFPLLRAE